MKNVKNVWALTLILALFIGLFPRFSHVVKAETLDTSGLVTNATVYDAVTYGTTTYVGGNFTYIGPNTGSGAPITVSSGAPATTYPKFNGSVNVAIKDGSGGWYVGGDFTSAGGVSKTNLVHIDGTGAVDTGFSPEPNFQVQSLLLDGSTLYVGGAFSSIGGQNYSYLASVSATTGAANTWDALADGTVYDMALDGSTLYVVGTFTNVGGSYRSKAAAIDTGTVLATAWNPYVEGSVYSIAIDATNAYLGGSFWAVSSTSVSSLASVDLAGAVLSSWRPEPNSAVNDLKLDGTTLYVGGNFSTIGAASRNALASFDTGTGVVSSWDPSVTGGGSNGVNELELVGSTIYVGGDFTTVGTSTRYNVAGVNTSSGAVTSFDPYAGGVVNSVGISGDNTYLFVGGGFKSIGSGTYKKTGLAAFNNATNSVSTFEANLSGGSQAVYDLALSSDGTTLYAGGSFSTIDGESRESLAAVATASGTVVAGFDAAVGSSSYVYALLLDGSTLYVGGNFSSLSSTSRGSIGAVSSSTGALTSWDPGVSGPFFGYVYDLAKSGTTIYVGGNFNTAGGASRDNLAAIDATTGLATSWNPGVTGVGYAALNAIALSGSTLYIGGAFTTAGGEARTNLAAIDTSTGLATSWNPAADSTVQSLTVSSTTAYVGGDFATAGGSSRAKVAGISLATGVATSWNPGADNTVYSTVFSSGHLFVGGNFTLFDSVPMFYLSHYTLPTNSAPTVTISSATQKTDGSGTVDIAVVADDADDNDTVQLKVQYAAGTDCSAPTGDPTVDETDANTTATYGDPKVENDDTYQVGNASGYVTTSSGANTVNFDWSAMTDLPSVDTTTYCLRVTPYDGTDAGTAATTTVSIDNVVNVPGAVSLSTASTAQINVGWGANSNPDGTQYYAENTTAGTNSGWVAALSWANSGLACGTTYAYRVKARNAGSVETAFVDGSSAATLPCVDGGPSVSVFTSSSSSSSSSSDTETGEEEVVVVEGETVDEEVEVVVDEPVVEEETEVVEPISDQTKETIELVTQLLTKESNVRDDFSAAKKLEQAINVVSDTVTSTERVNYDILIEDEQLAEIEASVAVEAGDEGVVVEEPTPAELEENWEAANDPFLGEDLKQFEEALVPEEDGAVDPVKLSDAERIVEDKVDKQVGEKINELVDSGAGDQSFEWQVGGKKVVIDRDTQVYVTLDNKKAKLEQKKVDERGVNKLVIGPSTVIGDSKVSAVLLAMAGAPLDDPEAADKYFFGGFDGLKKKEVVTPEKPEFTNDLKGRTAGKGVLFWIGSPKKGAKLNLFAVDKVDPKNKKTWKVYQLGSKIVDQGNKAVFNLDFEKDLKDLAADFGKGKKKLFFVVQDEDGKGSTVNLDIDFAQSEDLNGVKLSKDLIAIKDPMGEPLPDGIKDPMGEPLPDGIKDPMGIDSSNLYTSVLLAQANSVKGRDLVTNGEANVKYLTGYAVPGSIVVVTWQSLTYSSVVISDASEGSFEVSVPEVLEAGNHEALVYVYDDSKNIISNVTSLLFGKGRG